MRTTSQSEVIAGLRADVGEAHVSTSPPDRDAYCRDLWPRTTLTTLVVREPPMLPDAVVWPGTPAEVAAVVVRCAAARVPIVPFGAGSGVCGGTLTHRGGVVVDVKRMKAIRRLDRVAGRCEVEAGLIGERFERTLERKGMTLGHFPSSIVCSTVGGWVAGRSAGQCSSRYGKIEDMVIDLEVVTGDGVIRRTPPSCAANTGPDYNQIFVGSEGTLGIITAATLRVHPQPAARAFRGWRAPSLDAALDIMRRTMQLGLRPAVLRVYDPLDTAMVGSNPNDDGGGGRHLGRFKAALSGSGGGAAMKPHALQAALSVPGLVNRAIAALPGVCLLIAVSEGEEAEARDTDEAIARVARDVGATDLGEGPGREWLAHRHDVSYKQSRIYESGAFVDTFEVATTWDRVHALYDAVRRAVSPHVVVMAHLSHAYEGGCSIYFTFAGAARRPEERLARYDAAWEAGLDAALAQGAVIAHHHGVGLSRIRHMSETHGVARRWFDALKPVLDPAGILNPGKVFSDE